MFLPLVAITAAVISVGASVISLEGSDPAPYEEQFAGFCQPELLIYAPYTNGENAIGNDFKVREVIVTGNFERCEGQTLLLTAELKSSQRAYAFRELEPGVSTFSFYFKTEKGLGDWHRLRPMVEANRLVEQGSLIPAQVRLEVPDITWVIASGWD